MTQIPYPGPTVYEMSRVEIKKITEQINELQAKKKHLENRAKKYSGSSMLYAEFIATRSDPF